jgi:hypothetical protein
MPAKKGVTEQKNYSEYEHLHHKKPKQSCRDGEGRALANVASNLRELDPREVNFLPREMGSIFRHFAEEPPYAAAGLRFAQRFHG